MSLAENLEGISFFQKLLFGVGHRRRQPPKNFTTICSGLSRTGTMSLKDALYRIDGTNCFHTIHLVRFGLVRQFKKSIYSDKELLNLIKIINKLGFDCVIDIFWIFAARLANLFPTATVVHAHRVSFEEWYASWTKIETIFVAVGSRPLKWFADGSFYIDAMRNQTSFSDFATPGRDFAESHPLPWVDRFELNNDYSMAEWRKVYINHEESIINLQNNKVVFDISQGWATLCNFYNCSFNTNTTAFPHHNSSASFALISFLLDFITITYPLPLFTFLLFTSIFAYRHLKKRRQTSYNNLKA